MMFQMLMDRFRSPIIGQCTFVCISVHGFLSFDPVSLYEDVVMLHVDV